MLDGCIIVCKSTTTTTTPTLSCISFYWGQTMYREILSI